MYIKGNQVSTTKERKVSLKSTGEWYRLR